MLSESDTKLKYMYLNVKKYKTYSIKCYFLSLWTLREGCGSKHRHTLLFFSGGCINVWSNVCVCIMHAKVIVNKSLMTEGVKNRLFLVLPTVQNFSTSEPIFSKKALFSFILFFFLNLYCSCAWGNNSHPGIHLFVNSWQHYENL